MRLAIMVAGALAFGVSRAAEQSTNFRDTCVTQVTVKGEAPSLLPKNRVFKLVWNDEFDGTELDASKWGFRTNFWGRPAHWFAKPEDGCVEVKGGKVYLKLKKRADGQFVSPQLQTGELMWDYPAVTKPCNFWYLPKRQPPKFVHKFGYYECRCRLQRKPGWWSAFWMQTETQGACLDPSRAGVEHDIMESFEPGEVIPHCFHANGYGADYRGFRTSEFWKPGDNRCTTPVKLDDGYHVFGMLWEPDGYTCYIDGRQDGPKVGVATGDPVSHVPEFVLISTEAKWYRNGRMTGKGVPELEAAAAASDDFAVDYVRVYDEVRR